MINRNQELQKNKQGSNPRVVTPPPRITRSSEMLTEKSIPIGEAPHSYEELIGVPPAGSGSPGPQGPQGVTGSGSPGPQGPQGVAGSGGTGGGGGDILLADPYNKDATGGILLCSKYVP